MWVDKFFNNKYNLKIFLYYMYPVAIDFCKYINTLQENNFIAFCHVIHILFLYYTNKCIQN